MINVRANKKKEKKTMTSLYTVSTLVSGMYTMYHLHPYIPYEFLFNYVCVPTVQYIANKVVGSDNGKNMHVEERQDEEEEEEDEQALKNKAPHNKKNKKKIVTYLTIKDDEDQEYEMIDECYNPATRTTTRYLLMKNANTKHQASRSNTAVIKQTDTPQDVPPPHSYIVPASSLASYSSSSPSPVWL